MIHPSAGETTGAFVTSLTGRRRADVVARLALSRAPVMAGRAAGDDARVVHACTAEGSRALVTGLTGRRGTDVVARLALSRAPIMAGRAA